MSDLKSQKALVVGVSNDQPIACGCAAQGVDLEFTYLNERVEPFVHPLAGEPGAEIVEPRPTIWRRSTAATAFLDRRS